VGGGLYRSNSVCAEVREFGHTMCY
jgi:hypothetical protein